MTGAQAAANGCGPLAAALAKAGAWLFEPLEPLARSAEVRLRPVVAVVGLSERCGTTTVARALGGELARRDPAGASAVWGDPSTGAIAPGGAPAGRLARAVGSAGGLRVRSAGRLCLIAGGEAAALVDPVRRLAPVVLDIGGGAPAGLGVPLADHVVLVAPPTAEPALAEVVANSLARIGTAPLLLVNRLAPDRDEAERWDGRVALTIPESRPGARLALAGRDAGRIFGPALGELAGACELVRTEW